LSRLALGTVQFGLNYGVTNTVGKVNESSVTEMLNVAAMHQINTIDTAIGYGDSEHVLGQNNINDFNIISKIPPLDDNSDVHNWVLTQLNGSLYRLGQDSLYGVLLHNPDDLFTPFGQKLYKSMINLKDKGLVKKIGISVYSPKQLDKIFLDYDFDIVQAPLNIIDRRLEESGWLSKLNKMNIEIHIRSVFLQGLLLLAKNNIPKKFNRWSFLWSNWEKYILQNRINPIEACLSYPLKFAEVDRVIVGAQNREQLKEIINASNTSLAIALPDISSNDEHLINPGNWNNL